MGRAGRTAVAEQLARLRADWALDFIVVNGENATGGMGLSAAHAKELLDAGADCITLGDHAFDQRDMNSALEAEPRIIRPLNYARTAPGGWTGVPQWCAVPIPMCPPPMRASCPGARPPFPIWACAATIIR